jgi:hypothetical protein
MLLKYDFDWDDWGFNSGDDYLKKSYSDFINFEGRISGRS